MQKDIQIDRVLRSYADAGVSATYHACDVSDRAALNETLARIRQADGPIAGILHGAGIERSGKFEKKTRETALHTISVKVDGAANLMALTRHDPIRHFVGFGSISGRLGGFGQADYSLANEMLCKLIGAYRRQRPWIQAVGFHWHAWDEVGMAARPETKEILEATGNLPLMPVNEGVAHLLREMIAGDPEPEVMITERHHWQKFTAGMAEMNAKQLTKAESAATASAVPANLPKTAATGATLVRNVRMVAGATVADLLVDPVNDAFLAQHRLRNKPLLPVVVGLQALLEVAAAATQRLVVGFRDVDMIDGLMFHGTNPGIAQVQAKVAAADTVQCQLSGDIVSRAGKLVQKDRPYLRAIAETSAAPLQLKQEIAATTGEWLDYIYPDDAPMYHGPPFRGACAGCYVKAGGSARVMALPLANLVGAERAGSWTIPSVVLDSAMYACGLHLWAFHGNLIGLPKSIGHLQLGRKPIEGEACLVHFEFKGSSAERAAYDFDVVGADGAMILRVRDYGKVVIGVGAMG